MAESSWPTVAGGQAVSDVQYEQLATSYAPNGVIGAPTDSSVAFGASTGMVVTIRSGKLAMVQGHGWTSGGSNFTVAVTANASGSTRIDQVVLRLTRSTWAITTVVKPGTPGSGVPPALTQDLPGGTTGVWEIPLATVTVASGATGINAADVVQNCVFIGANTTPPSPSPPLYYWEVYPGATPLGTWNATTAPTSDSVSAAQSYQSARSTYVKRSPTTRLEIDMRLSGFVSQSGGQRVLAGVRIIASGYTSTNFYVCHNFFQGLNVHEFFSGVIAIPNLPAGSYTVQPWIYVGTSPNVFSMDSNDEFFLKISEV